MLRTTLVAIILLSSIHFFTNNEFVNANFVNLDENAWMRGRRTTSTYNTSQYASKYGVGRKNSNDMAVFIPFPYELSKNRKEWSTLHCTLTKLRKFVTQTTQCVIYLFVQDTELSSMDDWLNIYFPELKALPIDKDSWSLPPSMKNWTASPYVEMSPVDPYQLSTWKLSFAPSLAKELGFKYMMIVEANAMFMSSVDFDIVQHFATQDIALAFRNKTYLANAKSIAGLPELAKFWMITRNILTPPGTLYSQFTPSDIFHVDTASWNRHIFQDPFVIINLDFWHEEPVQNFLQLVFTSGGELLRLWKSQAVYVMIRLLFLGDNHLYGFPQSSVLYDPIADNRLFKFMECAVLTAQDSEYDYHYYQSAETQARGVQVHQENSHSAVTSAQELGAKDTDNQTNANIASAITTTTALPSTLTVELPILLHSMSVEILPLQERLRELFLFHWKFNPGSCGADTAIINNYTGYLAEAEAKYLRAHLWWHKHRVDAQLEKLISNELYTELIKSDNISSRLKSSEPMLSRSSSAGSDTDTGTATYTAIAIVDANATLLSREVCRDIVEQQLAAYVRFFCSYGFQGRKMAGYEEGLLQAARQRFLVMWDSTTS